MSKISVVLPARNEAKSLARLLPALRDALPDAEVIVVNDGSTDDTAEVCRAHDVGLVSHPYSKGNGAAIKSGAAAASGDVIVFMDADGQHEPARIGQLLDKLDQGYDMVIGARGAESQASLGRLMANGVYNRVASWMVGQDIRDLTSGFRAVRAERFREFVHLLPNGFSYPTTITMAFYRAGYSVAFVPVVVHRREGRSHIRPIKDGVRFLLIIFRVSTLYSPLRLFFPVSLAFFLLGLGYYAYTYLSHGRLTNMSALLFSASVVIFLIGLVSEQITMLIYQKSSR